MNRSRASGFTLIELLVTALIVMFILFILARSMDFVTRTVTGEYRKLEVERTLETAHRVLQDDLHALVKSSIWVFTLSTEDDQPALAFLRYRLDAPGDQATEWVQYWREKHPQEDPRLFQWVRYSGPAENRLDTPLNWWEDVERTDLDREIVLDDAMAVEVEAFRLNASVTSDVFPPSLLEVVDVRMAATTTPYPVVGEVPENLYEWVQRERGAWIEFRVRPEGTP